MAGGSVLWFGPQRCGLGGSCVGGEQVVHLVTKLAMRIMSPPATKLLFATCLWFSVACYATACFGVVLFAWLFLY